MKNFNVAAIGPGGLACPFVHLFTHEEFPPCVHTSQEEYEECKAAEGTDFQTREYKLDDRAVAMHVCQGHTGSYEFLVECPSKIHALAEQSEAFVLLYSIASRRSFQEIANYLHPVIRNVKTAPVPIVIVGVTAVGEIELEDAREVDLNEGAKLAEDLGCPFFEIPIGGPNDTTIVFSTLVREIRAARTQHAAQETCEAVRGVDPGFSPTCALGCVVM